ncbi:hypothetical protein BGX26_008066 [Mortierella sp. AD094]|nr:hypothetical protein BGX26_008066 [Mortierella sp. AD094]
MATKLDLRFAIIGESETTKPYMRGVDGNMDTEELKKAIYQFEPGLFENVKASSQLQLYRVSLPSSEYTSDREFSEDDAKPQMVIDGTISDYFQDGAEKNHIHIIVKRPKGITTASSHTFLSHTALYDPEENEDSSSETSGNECYFIQDAVPFHVEITGC